MTRNVYSSAVFAGGRPFCTQILPGQGRPHKPFLAESLANRIPLRSLVLTQYRGV